MGGVPGQRHFNATTIRSGGTRYAAASAIVVVYLSRPGLSRDRCRQRDALEPHPQPCACFRKSCYHERYDRELSSGRRSVARYIAQSSKCIGHGDLLLGLKAQRRECYSQTCNPSAGTSINWPFGPTGAYSPNRDCRMKASNQERAEREDFRSERQHDYIEAFQ